MKHIAFIMLFILCSCASDTYQHGVPNLAQVEPGLWRGGQPTSEGWRYLSSLGVRRTIKLNTEHEASDAPAHSNGIEVLRFPITATEQTIGKPGLSKLNAAVQAISTNGTYVHCQHGQDRTGLVIGAYRVRIEHWPKGQAYREMLTNRFHPLLRGLCWSWEEDVR